MNFLFAPLLAAAVAASAQAPAASLTRIGAAAANANTANAPRCTAVAAANCWRISARSRTSSSSGTKCCPGNSPTVLFVAMPLCHR